MNATPAFQDPRSPLMSKIQTRIQESGPIPFLEYMTMALYDPDDGYYATQKQTVGQQGDFITSVSVGKCFGMLLAQRLLSYWEETGKQHPFHIIEPGAHDGTLCADILSEIKQLSPEFYTAVHYHLIDATPALTQAQQKKLLPSYKGKFTTHQNLSDLHNLHGAILSNELIDAFPVELIQWNTGQWSQMMVGLSDENGADEGVLTMSPQTINNQELDQFCQQLNTSLHTNFPDHYTTEYNPGINPFTRDAAQALESGIFITIDYGHSTEDYYHPNRTTGTLQTYHQHQKSDDPLVAPGEIDITTHIDFTRLITAAETHGFHHPKLRTQASYLTDHARTWLLDIENPDTPTPPDTSKLLRQFQTLIHPAMLGTKFTVLEMRK